MLQIQDRNNHDVIDEVEKLPRLSQRMAKNSLVVLFGQILSQAANLGVTVLLARHLGQAGFGLFSYAIVFVSLFAILADFGMQAILIREISRQKWSTVEIIGNAVVIKALLSGATIVLILSAAWMTGASKILFNVIAILAFNILITAKLATLRSVFETPFSASLQMEAPILAQLLDNILLVGIIYGLTRAGAGLEALVIGYALSNLPGLLVMVWATMQKFPFHLAFNRELIRFLTRESLPLLLYSVLITLFNGLDVLLLKNFLGESEVGLYSAALRLTTPLLFIPQVIVASLFPLLSRYDNHSNEKLAEAFHLGLKMILLIALALAIATTFFATQFIQLLYAEAYKAATKPLMILMWSQVFLFLIFFFINVLTSIKQQRMIISAAAVMLIANGAANWILIPKLGIEGAALAKLFASFCGAAVLFKIVSKTFIFKK